MSRELQLLAADCRQALFDAVKADEGAGNSLRFEVGRAVGLLGRLSDALPTSAPDMSSALNTILALIGNVDHSTGDGPNAAAMRGGILNDIREIAQQVISRATTTAEGVA